MPRQRRREPGRVLRIPLGDGYVGWGRQLRGVQVEFYARFDVVEGADNVTLREVVGGERAFALSVMDSAFRASSGWELLDVVPLSRDEEAETYRFFKQDSVSGALSIYWVAPDGSWGEDEAAAEQCADLERAAVWSPSHVEDRLRDHRAGRPNKWTESLAPKK